MKTENQQLASILIKYIIKIINGFSSWSINLFRKKQEIIKTCDDILVNHYPDNEKSRSQYLPLLEMSVKEDPEDDRNIHYLGWEYMYYQRWNECIN